MPPSLVFGYILFLLHFYKHFPIEGHNVKYPKSGFFWTNSNNYNDLEKTLNRVINSSNKRWKKVVEKYSSELINYDANNIKAKKQNIICVAK